MRMYNFDIERMRWKNKGRKLFSKQAWYHFSITRKKINLAKCIYNASFIIFVLDINNYSHTQPHVLIAQFTCSEIIGHRKCHMENWRLIRFVLPPFHMKHKNIQTAGYNIFVKITNFQIICIFTKNKLKSRWLERRKLKPFYAVIFRKAFIVSPT